jgi:hypothetical protein
MNLKEEYPPKVEYWKLEYYARKELKMLSTL